MKTQVRRVCVVTGSRAEYGLLYWILHDLKSDPDFELQLVVTGMHLAPEFGCTVGEIEKDGFQIADRVEMLLASDNEAAIAKSVALGIIGMSGALQRLRPDAVLVLGDRFEIFAAAQACLFHRVPLVHIAGGDVTEGAYDESMRHAITKLAHVHLVTNELSARRVAQMGEDPHRIHVVGNPGLDHLNRQPLLKGRALEEALGATLGRRNLLVTFHPVTLARDSGVTHAKEMLAALDSAATDATVWVTAPNADTGGREIAALLNSWVTAHQDRARFHTSLGQLRYLSLMARVNALVGNSSSGLYEAPTLQIPTVNIGDRQGGRLAAASVLNCAPHRAEIAATIEQALAMDPRGVVNPYGDGYTAARVIEVLRQLPGGEELIRKPFHLQESTSA